MDFDLPSPRDLAIAIAQTSYTEIEKRNILQKLPSMSKDDIIALYDALLDLHKAEVRYLKKIEQIDLKYALEFQKAISK
jgi:hypothetical protein